MNTPVMTAALDALKQAEAEFTQRHAELEALDARIAQAKSNEADLNRSLDDLAQKVAGARAIIADAPKAVAAAEAKAKEITARAQEEADALKVRAKSDAERIIVAAKNEAAQLIEHTNASLADTRQRQQAAADELTATQQKVTDAHAELEQMKKTARDFAER